jgi:hypothetical protein
MPADRVLQERQPFGQFRPTRWRMRPLPDRSSTIRGYQYQSVGPIFKGPPAPAATAVDRTEPVHAGQTGRERRENAKSRKTKSFVDHGLTSTASMP